MVSALASVAPGLPETDSPWSIQTWKIDDGLPHNNVTSIAQTPDGYLWVATPWRVARFDGVLFDEFYSRTLSDGRTQVISELLPARDGSLWLAMDHGPIIRLNSKTASICSNGVPDQLVLSMTEDSDGAVWVTYREGVVCRVKDGVVKQFSVNEGMPAGAASCSMARSADGKLWFAKSGRIGVFRGDKPEVLHDFRSGLMPIRLAPARDGSIWLTAGLQLLKYKEGGEFQDMGWIETDRPGSDPTVLLETHDGSVWIGTSDIGLLRRTAAGFERVPTSHRQVLSLLEDREGNLWVGTGGGGLNRLQPRVVTLEDEKDGLPFESIQSVCQDKNGTLWATTENGQVARRDAHGWTTISGGPEWPLGMITCLAADRSGAIWMGSRNRRLFRYENGQMQVFGRPQGLTASVIHALLIASNDDLWIGGNGPESFQRFRDGKFESFVVPPEVRVIRAMAEDTKGVIWAGSSKGVLLRACNGKVEVEGPRGTGPGFSIRSLVAMPDGSVWVGYVGAGLGRFKDGNWSRITTRQGLHDDVISQMVFDGCGSMWFGADHGIFKVRMVELEAIMDGRRDKVHSIAYGRSRGAPSLQANFGDHPGALRACDQRLWIPMRSGLAVVNPTELRENLEPPPVLLKRVLVNGQTVALYGGPVPVRDALDLQTPKLELHLPPDHRRLEMEFTALSFGAPENVQFQYQLAGFDEGWRDVKMPRVATYSRLPAGKYDFYVRACNGDGVWNEPGASLALTVEPVLWQRWWFRLIVLVVFTSFVTAIARYLSFRRLQMKVQLLEQQTALDKERARIARDIHDDLGSRLTKVVMLSGLIQRDRAVPDKTDERAQQITEAARQVIKSLDETVWAVNPRNDTLPHLINYIGQFAVEFLHTAGTRCRLDLPDHPPERPVSSETRHNLFLIVKETLNNIVRHARADEVRLSVSLADDALKLVIEDNGCGFDGEPSDATADGLRNMRQRMQMMKGRLDVESSPGAGTRISMMVPLV